MKNGVQFKIKGLNQEKNLNILAKKFPIYDIVRVSKNSAVFKVNIMHAKKVRKALIDLNYEIIEENNLKPSSLKYVLPDDVFEQINTNSR